MNYKKRFIPVLVILVFVILSRYCAAREEVKMVAGTNENVVVRAECVNTSTGLTVGFRVEIMNHSKDKNLVVVVYDDMSYLYDVRLINKAGIDISPMRLLRSAKDKRGPNSPKAYRYDTILPNTNLSWFIPVPNQVRVDAVKPTNDNNLMPTPNGEYMVEINVTVGYFMQNKGEKSVPKFPAFQYLKLTLPRIPIVIDSSLLGRNLEDIYREELLKLETNKQVQISVTNNLGQ